MEKRTLKNNGFIPLEITTDFSQQSLSCGLNSVLSPVFKQRKSLTGFTLAEAMISLVILTMAAAALILPFASGAAVEQQGIKQTIATKLAGDLVEQILADPNNFSQTTVTYYDNYSEPNGQIKDANGIIFSSSLYADLSRNADCNYIYVPQQGSFGTQNFLKITVRTYQNGLKLSEIVRLKSK